MAVGFLGMIILIFISILVFTGTKLTLIGLILVTCIYGVARWRIGYPCWDDYDGPIKSGLAAILLVCLVYTWGSVAYNNRDDIKPVVDKVLGVFAK